MLNIILVMFNLKLLTLETLLIDMIDDIIAGIRFSCIM